MTRLPNSIIVINSSNKMRDFWTDLEYSIEKDQYYISTQENKSFAKRKYKKISKELAQRFIKLDNEVSTDRAVDSMNHHLFVEVQEEDRESYNAFWAETEKRYNERKKGE